jgi:uncharacterized protein (TIGR03437 family)
MCHNVATRGWPRCTALLPRLLCGFALAIPALWSQTTLDWRHTGGFTVERDLAGPAGGRVDAVWFNGTRLLAKTSYGRVFETADLEHWRLSTETQPKRAPTILDAKGHLPEAKSMARTLPEDPSTLYALATNVYRSRDGGTSWQSITDYHSQSVIGGGMRDLAVAPDNPDHLVVANDFGIWHSTDGGFSWSSLNEGLPNLPATRFLPPASSSVLPGLLLKTQSAHLSADREHWLLSNSTDNGELQRRRAAAVLKQDVNVVAAAGDVALAASSDGRLWFSTDGGATYAESRGGTNSGHVERIYLIPGEGRVGLAIAGSRVLQTANGGAVWNDMTGNLPDGDWLGVTADREGGAVYVAGDKGVFWARADLNAAASAATWTPISTGLPDARLRDVRLESNGNQLFVALEGYGVYSTLAPHRAHTWRLVNAADLSLRAAAPGSLLSLQGGKVDSATANGFNLPVLAAAASGSQIQIPFEADGTIISLDVLANTKHFNFDFPVKSHSPAIFVDADGSPVLVDADTGLTLDSANTARANSRVQLLMTGLGRVQPDFPTGRVAPAIDPPAVAAAVKAFLDGVEVRVTRATLAPGYVGCYLVEIQLPAIINAGPAEIFITAGGEPSNKVSLHLSQ